MLLLFLISTLVTFSVSEPKKQPNIVFILADDLGWNDVGFHGSNQIPTPNIDALAYTGTILNKYYVQPLCTPSRSALMTGKHPIHTGMQHFVLYGSEPRGLSLTEKLLPEWLRDLGYSTHCVGKWHLGMWKADYTPTRRGFDSHLGFWTGHQDYFDHTADEWGPWGFDMRRGFDLAVDLHGQYSTDIFTNEAVRLINTHNTSKPLFLYLAHGAVHSANPYSFLPAPDEDVENYSYIKDYKRNRFAAVLSHLDKSVGEVIQALKDRDILENTIIVFSTDNGGAAGGFNNNTASNWPLRGGKYSLWEGGVRASGVLWAPGIKRRVSKQLFQISDWLPTLYTAAGGNVNDLGNIDGVDMWDSLLNDLPSPRENILHNIDDKDQIAAVLNGDYKLVQGQIFEGRWNDWYGPSGRDDQYNYNMTNVINSLAAKAFSEAGFRFTEHEAFITRKKATVSCNNAKNVTCQLNIAPCLFNIEEDPCELHNLANEYPEVLEKLSNLLREFNETAVPAGNLDLDPRGDAKHWNYVWTNFGDYLES